MILEIKNNKVYHENKKTETWTHAGQELKKRKQFLVTYAELERGATAAWLLNEPRAAKLEVSFLGMWEEFPTFACITPTDTPALALLQEDTFF